MTIKTDIPPQQNKQHFYEKPRLDGGRPLTDYQQLQERPKKPTKPKAKSGK